MMLYHNTKFGNKFFCGSGFKRYIPDKQSLTFWTFALDLECSTPIFLQNTPAYDADYKTKCGCKHTSFLEDIVETVIFRV